MFLIKDRVAEQRDMIVAYKHVFSSDMGKKVLFDLINKFNVLNPTPEDVHKATLAEGRRQVVLHIIRQCNINPDEFCKMLSKE